MMIKTCFILTFVIAGIFMGACNQLPGGTNIPIYTVPPQNEKRNQVPPPSSPPQAHPSTKPTDQTITRTIVIDERNYVFGIGLWAGYIEEREITAQRPIDIWFEYIPDEMQLEINGVTIQRSQFSREYKPGYTAGVTNLRYKATNPTVKDMSYNLYLIPSRSGDSVSAIVKEKWIPSK
jgi:hypothetical protein